jgi:hypothetical protein
MEQTGAAALVLCAARTRAHMLNSRVVQDTHLQLGQARTHIICGFLAYRTYQAGKDPADPFRGTKYARSDQETRPDGEVEEVCHMSSGPVHPAIARP